MTCYFCGRENAIGTILNVYVCLECIFYNPEYKAYFEYGNTKLFSNER